MLQATFDLVIIQLGETKQCFLLQEKNSNMEVASPGIKLLGLLHIDTNLFAFSLLWAEQIGGGLSILSCNYLSHTRKKAKINK